METPTLTKRGFPSHAKRNSALPEACTWTSFKRVSCTGTPRAPCATSDLRGAARGGAGFPPQRYLLRFYALLPTPSTTITSSSLHPQAQSSALKAVTPSEGEAAKVPNPQLRDANLTPSYPCTPGPRTGARNLRRPPGAVPRLW